LVQVNLINSDSRFVLLNSKMSTNLTTVVSPPAAETPNFLLNVTNSNLRLICEVDVYLISLYYYLHFQIFPQSIGLQSFFFKNDVLTVQSGQSAGAYQGSNISNWYPHIRLFISRVPSTCSGVQRSFNITNSTLSGSIHNSNFAKAFKFPTEGLVTVSFQITSQTGSPCLPDFLLILERVAESPINSTIIFDSYQLNWTRSFQLNCTISNQMLIPGSVVTIIDVLANLSPTGGDNFDWLLLMLGIGVGFFILWVATTAYFACKRHQHRLRRNMESEMRENLVTSNPSVKSSQRSAPASPSNTPSTQFQNVSSTLHQSSALLESKLL
jgi:hypothetical protein